MRPPDNCQKVMFYWCLLLGRPTNVEGILPVCFWLTFSYWTSNFGCDNFRVKEDLRWSSFSEFLYIWWHKQLTVCARVIATCGNQQHETADRLWRRDNKTRVSAECHQQTDVVAARVTESDEQDLPSTPKKDCTQARSLWHPMSWQTKWMMSMLHRGQTVCVWWGTTGTTRERCARRSYDVSSGRNRIVWWTVSNAADRSSNVSGDTSPPSTSHMSLSCSCFSTAVSVEWWARWRSVRSSWVV